jgi:drug/metabolite transporter (DMT)-like permease
VLGAAFMYSYYQLAARAFLKAMGNRLFTSLAMTTASLAIFAHFLAAGNAGRLLAVSPRVLWLSCLMAVISTVLPSFMINSALERIGAQPVSVIGTVSPVATIFMAVLLVGEAFTMTDALGTALVIGGVGLYTWYDSRQKPVVAPAPGES